MPQTLTIHVNKSPCLVLTGGYKRFGDHTASIFVVEDSFNNLSDNKRYLQPRSQWQYNFSKIFVSIKNTWVYISTLPYVFMPQCSITQAHLPLLKYYNQESQPEV